MSPRGGILLAKSPHDLEIADGGWFAGVQLPARANSSRTACTMTSTLGLSQEDLISLALATSSQRTTRHMNFRVRILPSRWMPGYINASKQTVICMIKERKQHERW